MNSVPTSRGTPSSRQGPRLLLAAAIVLWAGALVRTHFALGELADIRRKNDERVARIRSLDPEFRAIVTRDLALGRLLDQANAAPEDRIFAAGGDRPALSVRPLATTVGGHPLREVTATWEAIPTEALARILHEAESAEPPLRLRRIEIAPRSGGAVSAVAVFETL